MARIYADRVKDTFTTTGTGAVTVSGTAAASFRTFSAVCSTSDTFYYCIEDVANNAWETGLGTYSGTNQITRTTMSAFVGVCRKPRPKASGNWSAFVQPDPARITCPSP